MVINVEVTDYLPTNAYLYIDDATRHGFLVDPGAQADKLLRVIDEKKITVEKILITHGHFDHIGAANELTAKLNVPLVMRRAGKNYADAPDKNLSSLTGNSIVLQNVVYVDDFSTVTLDGNTEFAVKVLPLPGHTTDGTVFYAEKDKLAFVGDSVFKDSYGRTDLPGGDEETLLKNIVKIIFAMPDETILYTGHGEMTTVAVEKRQPFYVAYI